MSSNTLKIVQGIAQAAANAYDGSHDERYAADGKARKIGLNREEGDPILDKRVIDGFKVKFSGDAMCIVYQSDIMLKDIYAGGSGFDIQNIQSEFGVNVTRISTLYGNLNLVMEPLFRNQHQNTAIMIDLNNVAYRPLEGNGVSRDTQIITNVQGDGVDGRKDMILTEAGLEISLPETHTVLQFV